MLSLRAAPTVIVTVPAAEFGNVLCEDPSYHRTTLIDCISVSPGSRPFFLPLGTLIVALDTHIVAESTSSAGRSTDPASGFGQGVCEEIQTHRVARIDCRRASPGCRPSSVRSRALVVTLEILYHR